MIHDIKYSMKRDLMEVDKFGYVDLREAGLNNSIPAAVNVDELSFNDIEDPSTIVGKPSDIFDAINMNVSISNNPLNYVEKDDE